MKKKTTTLLITTLLFLTLTTAQITINEPEQDYATNEELTIEIETEENNQDYYLKVEEILNDGAEEYDGEISSDDVIDDSSTGEDSNTAEIEWDWDHGDDPDYAEINITVDEENEVEDEENEVEDFVTVHLDTIDPDIEENSIDVVRNDDGTVDFSWSMVGDGYSDGGYDYTLMRRENDTDDDFEEAATGSASDGNEGADLTDENEDWFYGALEYDIEVEDNAGNSMQEIDAESFESSQYDEVKFNDDNYIELAILDGLLPTIGGVEIAGESYDDFNEDIIVSDDSPDIEVEYEAVLSNVVDASLVWGPDDSFNDTYEDETGTSNTQLEIEDLSDLSDGTKILELVAEDKAENKLDMERTFTIDTAAPDPDAWLRDFEELDVITSTKSMDIAVDENDLASENIAEVECIIGKPDVGDYITPISTSPDPEQDIIYYDCGDIDPDEYDDGEIEVHVRFEDEAGNTGTKMLSTLIFDSDKPEIDTLDLEGGYVNSPPRTYIEASNQGTEIEEVEYTFSTDVSKGEGKSIDFEQGNNVDFHFTPDMSDLSDDDYELIVRARDDNEWSEDYAEEFTLDREAEPNVSLEYGEFSVDGELNEAEIDIDVVNDGLVALSAAELEVETESYEIQGESEEFDVSGESTTTVSFNVTKDETFGVYNANIHLISDDERIENEITFNIQATENESETVDEGISSMEESIEELESDIGYLRDEGAGDDIITEAEDTREEMQSKLNQLKNASEDEEYYRVAGEIDNVEEWSEDIVEAGETARSDYRSSVRWFYIQVVGGSALVFALISGVIALRKSDYVFEINPPEDINIEEIPEYAKNSLGAAKFRVEQLKDSFGDSDKDEDWEGFK